MAASDDFKQLLKAGKIAEALAMAMGEAVELEITTWVSTSATETEAKPGSRLHTRLNLINNDLENEVGTDFLGNAPYRELRQFHQEQVLESHQIIQNNISSLQTLFEFWVKLRYSNLNSAVKSPLSDVETQQLPSGADTNSSIDAPSGISLEPDAIASSENLHPATTYLPAGKPPTLEALHLGTETDWNRAAWEHPQSFPAASVPSLDALHLGTTADWGKPTQLPSEPVTTPSTATNLPTPSESENTNSTVERQSVLITPPDFEAGWDSMDETGEKQSVLITPPDLEADWDSMDETQMHSLPATPPPSPLDTQGEWGDIANENEDLPINSETPEVWDDWEVEVPEAPFGELPTSYQRNDPLNQELEENWDEFVPDELESYPPSETPHNSVDELETTQEDDLDLLIWDDEPVDSNLLEEFERLSPPPEVITPSSTMSDDTWAEWLGDADVETQPKSPSSEAATGTQPAANDDEEDLSHWLEDDEEDPFKTLSQPDEPHLPHPSQNQSHPQ